MTHPFCITQWEKRARLPPSQRNPVEAFPGDIVFFFRVATLLRGLCAILSVRIKYMDVFAPYAKLALVSSIPNDMHARAVVHKDDKSPEPSTYVAVLWRLCTD